MDDEKGQRENRYLREYVTEINGVFRRVSKGMELRLLKGDVTPEGDLHVFLSVGERGGHTTWWDENPASMHPLEMLYGGYPSPFVNFVAEDRKEHHAYRGEFTFSVQMIEREEAAPAIIAGVLLDWWHEGEAMEAAERVYQALAPTLQEAIGYFVDEPIKQLDFNQPRDLVDWQTYQTLANEGLVRAERSFFGMDGRATVTDQGAPILRYLAMMRKKQAEQDKQETDDAT